MRLLDEELVILDADVKTAEDCIRLGGTIFYEKGYVKDGYTQAVIDREKVYPTGLPGKGVAIAIPHTNNTYVNKPAVGVIVPREPVRFCAMGTKDVWLDCSMPRGVFQNGNNHFFIQFTRFKNVFQMFTDCRYAHIK